MRFLGQKRHPNKQEPPSTTTQDEPLPAYHADCRDGGAPDADEGYRDPAPRAGCQEGQEGG